MTTLESALEKAREGLEKLNLPIGDMNEHFIQRRIATKALSDIERILGEK